MEPLLKNGAKIVVDREAPCLCGDLPLIYHRPELVPAGELPLSVKQLVTTLPDSVRWKDHPESEIAPVGDRGDAEPETAIQRPVP